jgi:DNA mismatch endonuclease (patch repair protein)
MPKSHRKYWQAKLDGNVSRDKSNERALRKLGWRLILIWECEVSTAMRASKRLTSLIKQINESRCR